MVWSWVSADPRFGETRTYSLLWYLRTASNNSRQKLVPVSVALSKWDHFFSLADGVLVHSRATPWCYFSSNRLNTSVERDNVEWNLLADWGNNAMTGPRLEIGSWDVIKPDDLTTFSQCLPLASFRTKTFYLFKKGGFRSYLKESGSHLTLALGMEQ